MKKILLLGVTLLTGFSAWAAERDSLAFRFGNAVSGDVLERSSEVNIANSLFGQLSGLYVMQSTDGTNVLDYQASMNIRGISTFGNATPLILVDGIERDMANLTVAEIERVEVLKDAVASAIYGIRGANGVVLITTKRGSQGFKASVNYKASFDKPFRLPEFVDSYTYAGLLNEALELDGLSPRYSPRELEYFRDGTNPELYPNVDWQNMAYRDYAMKHQVDFQFKGGSDRFKYYTTVTYANVSGLLNHTDMFSLYNSQLSNVQMNVRTNFDVKVTKSTILKLNLLVRLKEQKRPATAPSTLVQRLYDTPSAAFPVQTGTGAWGSTSVYNYNPIADIADRGTVKAIRRTLLADMTLRQELDFVTPGLYAEVTVAYDNMANYNDQRTRNYSCEMVTPVLDAEDNILGCTRQSLGTASELGWNSALNNLEMYSSLYGRIGYDRTFGKHAVDAQLVYEQLARVRNGRNSTMKRQSLYGVVSYDYDSRYNVDAVVNWSGTAVLAKGSRFNVYPAIGLGWTVSNESFLKNNPVITYLKVKSSFGLSGSDLFAHDLDRQIFGVSGGSYWFGANNTSFTGLKEGNLAVEPLLAEKSQKFDAGIELSLLKQIHVGATYFHEKRSDILVSGGSVISNVIGIGVPQLCQGVVKNRGVELSLNIADRIGKFGYSLSGNFTYAKNKIVENNEGFQPYDYLYKRGQSLNQHYGLITDGFFNSWEEIEQATAVQSFGELRPGDIRYVDQNGDQVINEDDMVRLGYSDLPEIYYGFNIGLSYGGFSIDALFQGVAHRDLYLSTSSLFMPLKNNTNISTWYVEDNVRWTPETAATANLPRLTSEANPNNFQKNDIWMCNGNFLKLRNLEIAYTFDKRLLKRLEAKVFLRGTNLFSIDNLKYADPENFGAAYPTMRSYTVGVDIRF